VPFTTAFFGDYPTQPLVVALYAANIGLSAPSFTLMGQYVFFKSALLPPLVSMEARQREFRRNLVGTFMYGFPATGAFVLVEAALGILLLIPFFYVVPDLFQQRRAEW
jgi:hypothetical protein